MTHNESEPMNASLFLENQIKPFDQRRLAGIYYKPHRSDLLGLCDNNHPPGKCSLYIYDWPVFPYRDPIAILYTLDEYRVFVGGHEIYHWLSHTRQISTPNTEKRADLFALKWLWKYRWLKLTHVIRRIFNAVANPDTS